LLNRQGIEGGKDGTRTFALAARRAYTGDYSVVVVLWSLIDNDKLFPQNNQAPPRLAELDHFQKMTNGNHAQRDFSRRFRYDRRRSMTGSGALCRTVISNI
jgi:hypothetical protein